MPNSGQWASARKFELHIYGNQEKWVPVTSVWRVLGLLLEERPPDVEGSSTRSGPPAWDLDDVLTTPHRKNLRCHETFHEASDFN